MALTSGKPALPESEELDRLADALDGESAKWAEYDISDRPRYPSQEYEARQAEEKRRANVMWQTAIEAGGIFARLSERGTLQDMPRIENAVEHVRSEMMKSRRGGKPPVSYFVVNVPYDPHREDSYDVFFVKLFEGLCKIFAKSLDDRRAFRNYYAQKQQRAAFQVRMLRAFAKKLRGQYQEANG
jgi:hypothetical protein